MWLCQSIADLKLLERRRQARITERRRERKKKDSGRSPSVTNNERTCLSDMLKSINSLLVRGCFYPDWCGPEKMLRICARKSHLACCRSGFGGQRAVQLGFDRVNGGTTGRGGGGIGLIRSVAVGVAALSSETAGPGSPAFFFSLAPCSTLAPSATQVVSLVPRQTRKVDGPLFQWWFKNFLV